MPYALGMDIGNSSARAAVSRLRGGAWAAPEPLSLEGTDETVESTLFVTGDGTVLAGSRARSHASAEPARSVRDVLDRVGDPVPLLLPSGPWPAAGLVASFAAWIAERATEREGEPPERIAVTHPSSWGPYRCRVLREALHGAGLGDTLLLPGVAAVAEAYGAREGAAAGATLGVCLLGGARACAAVVRRERSGFDVLAYGTVPDGRPGRRIDDLLADHALARAGSATGNANGAAPAGAMDRLRAGCRQAKEDLATEQHAEVPVPMRGGLERVSVSRAELDRLARPVVATALRAARDVLAPVPDEHRGTVLLAGGTARMPLAVELAPATLTWPVVTPGDPARAAALGAAVAARPGRAGEPDSEPDGERAELVTGSPPAAGPFGQAGNGRIAAPGGSDEGEWRESPPPRPPVSITPLEPPRSRRRMSLPLPRPKRWQREREEERA
ncbi:Hsp70 family protein [Haloechinothrix sp. LS1_15]|uniref:Hsp70 family protein n=1 Tax=Haloechinothrix sp. LS1_15 TaxID=2652248 RepID=UPI0029477278|nr:Hsp70 family protein [Haloechinothrix sp. LS1_15]MDV6014647.1 Hsp70 family protein [Haloechinothrix sp. LS1_15]